MDNNNNMIDNVNWFTLLMYKSAKAYCTDLEWVPMNKTYTKICRLTMASSLHVVRIRLINRFLIHEYLHWNSGDRSKLEGF